MKLKNGIHTALVTPFMPHYFYETDSNSQIDTESFKKLLDLQFNSDISGVIVAGTTGESPTLTFDEHDILLHHAVNSPARKEGQTVLAGTGSNNTTEAIELTKGAKELQADGALIVSPYYNKPTQEGFYRHIMEISNAVGDYPLVLYDIPSRTGFEIELPTLLRLIKANPNIVGLKHAKPNNIAQVIRETPDDFMEFGGDDSNLFEVKRYSGNGGISVASNVYPQLMQHYWNTLLDGNEKGFNLGYFFSALNLQTNPICVKAALHAKGLISYNSLRLPMTAIDPESEEYRTITKILEQVEQRHGI